MFKNAQKLNNQDGFGSVVIVLVVIVVLIVGAGIFVASKSKNDKTPADTQAASGTDKPNGTSTSTKVASEDKSIKLPNDFPKNLPQYPGSAITEALTSEVGSRLIMTSSDSQEKIMAYYLKELPKLGWTMGSREGDYVASEFLDAFHSSDLDGTIGTDTDNNGTTSISLSTIVK